MNLVNLLGCDLKSDPVIKLLESFDMEVIYDFDRLHENVPDRYSSSAETAGFELRFNEQQVLETVWCYVQPRHGFAAVDTSLVGVPCFSTFLEAQSYAKAHGVKTSEAQDGAAWIRLDYPHAWHHYEFSSSQLALVTLMVPWD